MKTNGLKKELEKALPVARQAALEAGELIRRKFGHFRKLSHKRDQSLVTEVDQLSEKTVCRLLKKHFPTHEILGEESGLDESRGKSPFRWHIDPLDGTTNFVHRFPIFCVSIGLEFEGQEPVLGVIHQPITGDLFTGVKGGGAFLNRKPIRVSATKTLRDSLLTTGFSMKYQKFLNDEIASFARISRRIRGVRRTGSAAMDLVYVASGQFDGFWERGLSPWDVAAALVIVQEAGGKYTQINGKPYRLGDETIVASNGKIHQDLVRVLR